MLREFRLEQWRHGRDETTVRHTISFAIAPLALYIDSTTYQIDRVHDGVRVARGSILAGGGGTAFFLATTALNVSNLFVMCSPADSSVHPPTGWPSPEGGLEPGVSDELVNAAGGTVVHPPGLRSTTPKTLSDTSTKPASAPTREPTLVASLSSLDAILP